MDMIEFVEKFMNIELNEWQKKYICFLEKMPRDAKIRIATGRRGQMYVYMDQPTTKELIQNGTTFNRNN